MDGDYLTAMREAGDHLVQALASQDPELVQSAAQRFIAAVENAWRVYQQGDIVTQVRGQALPRTMYHFAVHELPAMIAVPEKWPLAARQVRMFLNTVTAIAAGPHNTS